MTWTLWTLFSLLACVNVSPSNSARIDFPSGITLQSEAEVSRFADPEQTGSSLFRVGSPGVVDSKRLTLNVDIASLRDASSPYFRAHPVFLSCLQKAWTEVQNTRKMLKLQTGFKASAGDSLKDRYARAGTAARLTFAPGSAKNFSALIVAFLRHCPASFSPLGRDLGLIIETDAIFAYMTGNRTPSQLSVSKDGANPEFANVTDLVQWTRLRFNEVTQPETIPVCGADVKELALNGVHPSGATIDSVAPADANVTRSTASPAREDFLRLVQFPSDNVVFTIPPAEAVTCPAGGGYHGSGVTTRCGARLMSPRLFSRLNVLQKMAGDALSVKLQVKQGWQAEGGPSLRQEGREVRVAIVGGATAKLGNLSRLAVCAGFDFVKREATALHLAVVKQYGVDSTPVSFPSSELMPVAAPQQDFVNMYKLADPLTNSDYPLFDSKLQANVAPGVPLSLFRSQEEGVRYMRLNPVLLQCFTEILRWENRDLNPSKPKIALKIERAFSSNLEEAALFDPVLDERAGTYSRGIGLELRYERPDKTFSVWRLAQTAATVCPLVFKLQDDVIGAGRAIGIGIYNRTVHLSMRHKMKIWFQCEACADIIAPPAGLAAFRTRLAARISESLNNRIIDPTNVTLACSFDDVPKPQNPFFSHKYPEAVVRLKRATVDPPECRANAPLDSFCSQSIQHRQAEVTKVRDIISNMHLVTDTKKVMTALNECLLTCSKCTSGAQWDKKVEHCDNLLHWVPFGLLNDGADVISNLYPKNNVEAWKWACKEGSHCVDKSALHGLVDNTLRARFRPVSTKPIKEFIFDPVGNPSPLPSLIRRLYALAAHGSVNVWLHSEDDVIAMATSLKVLFVYNKAVTHVRFRVLNPKAMSVITGIVEAHLEEWRGAACPRHARMALTPYSVELAPTASRGRREAHEEQLDIMDMYERWETDNQRPDFI